LKTREGDLVETAEGLMFDVKGLIHPSNRVIAFIRYFPDEKGERGRGLTYDKVYSLSKRYELLRKSFPQYLVYDQIFDEELCEVPTNEITKHHKPIEKLQKLRESKGLDPVESEALQLAELLKEKADIPWNAIGVSGSILVGLHMPNSDIDLVMYGVENCGKAYSTLRNLLEDKNEPLKPYSTEDLKTLFEFRSKDTTASFEDFVRTESRKVMQGKFLGTDYFLRFVKDWNEINENYGDVQYKNVGYARIQAAVADDSESIFTPCKYLIENAKVIEGPRVHPITEIASFRGRFCEQARKGESVVAQGKVEQVFDRRHDVKCFRLLLGNKPSDFMILK
jgi:hypothetical protein